MRRIATFIGAIIAVSFGAALGMTVAKKNSEVRMQVRASRGLYGLLTASSGRGSLVGSGQSQMVAAQAGTLRR